MTFLYKLLYFLISAKNVSRYTEKNRFTYQGWFHPLKSFFGQQQKKYPHSSIYSLPYVCAKFCQNQNFLLTTQ